MCSENVVSPRKSDRSESKGKDYMKRSATIEITNIHKNLKSHHNYKKMKEK